MEVHRTCKTEKFNSLSNLRLLHAVNVIVNKSESDYNNIYNPSVHVQCTCDMSFVTKIAITTYILNMFVCN